MFTSTIQPRLGNTDWFGHINNCALAEWVEIARMPLFRLMTQDKEMKPENWSSIMVRSEYDYLEQMYFPDPVEIQISIGHIGTKSYSINHDIYQHGKLCAKVKAVLVYYDHKAKKSQPIPSNIRTLLEQHRTNDNVCTV
jgi:acyl-CoA thioester hydrolase